MEGNAKIPGGGGEIEQFPPNLFILGSLAYHQHTTSPAADSAPEAVREETNKSPESQDDSVKCEIICGQCQVTTAASLCRQCDLNYCSDCFHKVHQFVKGFANHKTLPITTNGSISEKVKL